MICLRGKITLSFIHLWIWLRRARGLRIICIWELWIRYVNEFTPDYFFDYTILNINTTQSSSLGFTGKSSTSINIFNCWKRKIHAPSWRQGGRSGQEFFQWSVRLFCQAVDESVLQIWYTNIVKSVWCTGACCGSSVSILTTQQSHVDRQTQITTQYWFNNWLND